MGYVVDQKSQINSELGLMMPRLKSFAAALTGSDASCQALVKATRNYILARMAKERGHMPLPLWAFLQMYRIWAGRMSGAGRSGQETDPRLFQPRSRINDGGVSARFAMQLAQLSPQQRGALHLVYGERLSYDEAAEIFQVPVSTMISRLAQCYAALGQSGGYDRARAAPGAAGRPRQDPADPHARERAA
ncbi:MAG: sigma factor-like helix-turn-helix DNA-binding protein [Rhodomicrobiaceae bacterium]